MSIIKDLRGNEFLGTLDQVGNQTLTDARVASATLSVLNAEILMDLQGMAVAMFDVRTAALNATLVFEGTVDGTNYIGLPGQNIATESDLAAVVITTTHAVVYAVDVSGFRRVRCRVSVYTSGNVVVTARASVAALARHYSLSASQLMVTATAAVNVASAATLTSGGAGLYHYITSISLVKLYAVVGVANGAGIIITTTNLPGTPAWTTEQRAGAAGDAPEVINKVFPNPLKSLVAGTNTVFTAPLQLQTIWRWNITYYVGA